MADGRQSDHAAGPGQASNNSPGGAAESPSPLESNKGRSELEVVSLHPGQVDAIVQRVVASLQGVDPAQNTPCPVPPRKATKKSKHVEATPSDSEGSEEQISPPKRPKSTRRGGARPSNSTLRSKDLTEARGTRDFQSWLLEPWCYDTPPSGDSEEEGTLSGSDLEEEEVKEHRLFPMEFFPKLMGKALHTLNLSPHDAADATEDPKSKVSSKFLPPVRTESSISVPLPSSFKNVIEAEWKDPAKPRRAPRSIHRLYSMPQPDMDFLKVPSVDQPIAALSSNAVLPPDGEGGPKDSCDKRVETALRREYENTALSLRAATANSIMARAMLSWIEDLERSKEKFSRATRNSLKKLSLAAAFASDSSLDIVKFSAKSLASNVMARRSVWLRHWEVDQGSQNRLAAFPFAGNKLFGQTLEPLLIENKDKRKVLPTVKKEPPKGRQSSSFRGQRSSFRPKEGFSRKPKWGKGRYFSKGRSSTSGDFSSSTTSASSKPKGNRPT